jgi:tetratricopeptide (TPR) repeat protein
MAHNYHMRAFACMMTGRGQETIDVLDRMVADIPDSFRVEWAWAIDGFFAMPLEARMRFGRWDEILAYPDMPEGLPLSTALRHYARGVAFAAQNNVVAARAEQRLFTEAAAKVGPEISFGNNTGPGVIEIARHVLAGEILFRSGKHEEGIAELKLAIAAEDALRYDEPPSWIQPCRHVLGAFYMSIGRFSDAEAVYREDLKILPDNGWSLYGLARSLELQERPGGDGYRKKFERIWKDADLSITSSCLCLP